MTEMDAPRQAAARGGRVALVTGAAGGIGRACAAALAAAGHPVALTDVDEAALAAADAPGPAGMFRRLPLDVTDEASVHRAFAAAEAGLGPVAVLVCCAGIMSEAAGDGEIADIPLERWERILAVNARGTFLCLREFLRLRRLAPVAQGRAITFSSSAAQLGGYRGDPCYVASKAAILGLTKIAARQAAALGITVNCIAPGPVRTGMFDRAMAPEAVPALAERIPLGRIGLPEDVAAAVCYLAGEGAGFVTGATLDVNGGYRMQ